MNASETAFDKAENDAAIAAYAAAELSGDPTRVWLTFVEVEHRMNTEGRNGAFDESDRIRAAINQIIRERNARKKALKAVEAQAEALCAALTAPYRSSSPIHSDALDSVKVAAE